jgi:hypothetical protein
MPKKNKNSEYDRHYVDKLAFLVRRFDHERKERFYWKFAKKTPIPMQDYLKVTYDL